MSRLRHGGEFSFLNPSPGVLGDDARPPASTADARQPPQGVLAMARRLISVTIKHRPGGTEWAQAEDLRFLRRARRSLPGLLPRTVQLCIHCRGSPAGFWVSSKGGKTVRRPWCLSCCDELDRSRCDVIPFGS